MARADSEKLRVYRPAEELADLWGETNPGLLLIFEGV